MKNLILIHAVLVILVFGACQKAQAAGYPVSGMDKKQSAEIETNQKLARVHAEIYEIISDMDRVKDQRKHGMEKIENALETTLKASAQARPYCNGRVVWALNQECEK